MITKISYKPYASGINNRQKQTDNVNFGARTNQAAAAAQKSLVQGVQLLGNLVTLFSIGKNKAENILPNMLRDLPAVLRKVGVPNLAKSFETEIAGQADAEILRKLQAAKAKPEPETLLDVVAALIHAGETNMPTKIAGLTDTAVRILEQNGAKGQSMGLSIAAKTLDTASLIQQADHEVLRAKNPWLAGVMQEFTTKVRGRQ